MTDQVNAYRKLFQDNIEMALQYRKAKLVDCVEQSSQAGGEKTRLILRAGSKNTRRRETRYDPMTFGDLSLQQRWITAYDWDVEPDPVDDLDKVRMGIEPMGYITQAHAIATIREKDQQIIDAFFASAKIGDDGGSTVAYDTGNSIAAGSTGMTVSKLVDAQTMLMDNHVDIETEMPYVAMTPAQREDLMRDIQVTSRDFNGGEPVLKNGKLVMFMGFGIKTIATDSANGFGLPVDGSSNRRCPVWVKSGMHLGTWQAPTTSISQRNDIRGRPFQCYTKGSHGATRTEEGKVGEILCAES